MALIMKVRRGSLDSKIVTIPKNNEIDVGDYVIINRVDYDYGKRQV